MGTSGRQSSSAYHFENDQPTGTNRLSVDLGTGELSKHMPPNIADKFTESTSRPFIHTETINGFGDNPFFPFQKSKMAQDRLSTTPNTISHLTPTLSRKELTSFQIFPRSPFAPRKDRMAFSLLSGTKKIGSDQNDMGITPYMGATHVNPFSGRVDFWILIPSMDGKES